VKDLLDKDTLMRRLGVGYSEKAILFKHLYHIDIPAIEDEVERLYKLGQEMKDYICDTFSLIDKSLSEGKKILYEGKIYYIDNICFSSNQYLEVLE
jgi:adenylosuccinate synthase